MSHKSLPKPQLFVMSLTLPGASSWSHKGPQKINEGSQESPGPYPEAVETHSFMPSRPGDLEAHPEAMETQTGAMKVHHEAHL
jgi:hypothetical protein